MRLYQPTWTRRDPTTGEKVLRRSRRWWVQFFLEGKRRMVSLGVRDRRAAEVKAAEILRAAELRSVGVADPFEEHRRRPIAEHLAEFETMLGAREVTEEHRADRLGCLRAFLTATGAEFLANLDVSPANEWLSDLRAKGLSARSVNRRVQALRQFGRWLHRSRRVAFDPFEGVATLNERTDRRHVRRALTTEELRSLVEAARRRPLEEARRARVNAGISPAEETRLRALGGARALLYAFAAGTGLRRGELSRVRWTDLDLEGAEVRIPAASAKARRDENVPLRSDLIAALVKRRAGLSPEEGSARLFSPASFPEIRTFRRDLAAAGIARQDESGRVVDFHSLRVTFVSSLAAAGVHPRTTQALARLSSVELAMRVYTDLSRLDLRGALEKVPSALPVAPGEPDPAACAPACAVGRPFDASACVSMPEEGVATMEEETLLSVAGSGRKTQSAAGRTGAGDGDRTHDNRLGKPALYR